MMLLLDLFFSLIVFFIVKLVQKESHGLKTITVFNTREKQNKLKTRSDYNYTFGKLGSEKNRRICARIVSEAMEDVDHCLAMKLG